MSTDAIKPSVGSMLGVLGALAVFIVMVGLSFLFHFSEGCDAFALTVIIAVTGVTIGWFVGFLAAPKSTAEQERFDKYAKTISAFMSGYVLSKIESWISALIDEGKAGNRIVAVRLSVSIACVLVGAISMYTFRLTLFRSEGKQEGQAQTEQAPKQA